MDTALEVVCVFIWINDKLRSSGDVKRDAGDHGAFGRYHRNPDRKRCEADLPVPYRKNIPGICNGEQITEGQKTRKRLQNSHENFLYL